MFYLQRDSEADLLSVVTEDAPRSAEQHEADPRLLLTDLLLQRHTHKPGQTALSSTEAREVQFWVLFVFIVVVKFKMSQ